MPFDQYVDDALNYRRRDRFDAHRVASKLYQGSAPPPGQELRTRGFDVLVLAAEEIQPPAWAFPGVHVIYAPSDDGDVVPEVSAHMAAREVAKALHGGRRVLVTCAMGLNRSGIITALSLWYLTGCPGPECAAAVKRARPNALCNPWFFDYVSSLPPRRGLQRRRRCPPRAVA